MSTNSGQTIWNKAKSIIPGGNMLLSKRPELFLPNLWPCYFSRSKGCSVWDLDGNHYFDFAQMSVGACSLGYSHDLIDNAVIKSISQGNMSTLNCAEEVFLAERLIDLHPWANMVRFARTGGEANAIAIRIARASTNREHVAICGYHGWHDWYLAANLSEDNELSEHLLPGLQPLGVPASLAGTTHPFSYNNLAQLKVIISKYKLAAVKMEVQRSVPPDPGFLQSIRQLCDENGIVLIFDECTSGFRQSLGGLHKIYGVNPDVSMFGKALGNGFAITAIVGISSVMQSAQSTFISSTFWTERIGPTAALKTLDVMESTQSWLINSSLGRYLKSGWRQLAESYGILITISGLDALPAFAFSSSNHLKYKTYLTQEMLKHGYLATTSVYLSTAHSELLIDQYLSHLEPIFNTIAKCENETLFIDSLLETDVCHSGFSRLN